MVAHFDPLSLAADPNLHFPRYPRLVDDLVLFDMPDGLGVQIRGHLDPVMIRGTATVAAFHYLCAAMNGSNSIEDILCARDAGTSKTAVEKCLSLLHFKGLITQEQRDTEARGNDSFRAKQVLFWSKFARVTGFNRSGLEAQLRLEQTTFTILANGLLGLCVYATLRALGITKIRIAFVGEDKSLIEDLNSADASASASALRDTEIGTWVEANVSDVLVVALRHAPRRSLLQINADALRANQTTMYCLERFENYDVGPLVLPGSSACYQCEVLREASVSEFAPEEEFFEGARDHESLDSPAGESFTSANLCAALMCSELVNYSTKISPLRMLGCVLSVDKLATTIQEQRFHEVPRCPACQHVR